MMGINGTDSKCGMGGMKQSANFALGAVDPDTLVTPERLEAALDLTTYAKLQQALSNAFNKLNKISQGKFPDAKTLLAKAPAPKGKNDADDVNALRKWLKSAIKAPDKAAFGLDTLIVPTMLYDEVVALVGPPDPAQFGKGKGKDGKDKDSGTNTALMVGGALVVAYLLFKK
jgi:hypothetical protein